MKTVEGADLFAGAGGGTAGLLLACQRLGVQPRLLAINHWDVAISSHAKNHPNVRHLCESLDNVDPRKVTGRSKLDILIASPECTHHSNARGGKPCSDQSRASAWHVLRWAEALYIRNILIENVREFQSWGPLDQDGIPIPERRGETFRAFLNALDSLGYNVDYKVVNSADYGDPTVRHRLFIQGRREGAVSWPAPTHTQETWKPARDIIDWGLPGESIFTRKRPLKSNTLRRIAAGVKRFCGDKFLVMLYGTNGPRDIDRPLPTVTANGEHIGLCEPFLVNSREGIDRRVHAVDKPLGTQDTSNRFGLCQPFIFPLNHGKRNGETDCRSYGLDRPLPTITTLDAWGLVIPEDAVCLDIKFRMLLPHELAKAMSFPAEYIFEGNREQKVKQIGNAVPVNTAAELCYNLLKAA